MRKRKLCFTAVILLLMLVGLSIPASAAKKKGITFDRYLKKGKNYTVMVYNCVQEPLEVRQKRSLKSGTICRLNYGDSLVVDKRKLKKKKSYEWIPVVVQTSWKSSRTGYVYAKKVTKKKAKLAALKTGSFSKNRTIDRAIQYGMRYLGTPFRLPGNSMTTGIDCASFVVQCFGAAGKATCYPHTDSLQMISSPVSKSSLKAGDLIFYRDQDPCSGLIGHVAIYIGDGFVLHASGHYGDRYPNGGVCIKRINYGRRVAAMYKRINGF